jgi:hypothetical protein
VIKRFAILMGVGFVIGLMLACAFIKGIFSTWHALALSPVPFVALTAFDGEHICTQTVEGANYCYGEWEHTWKREPQPLASDQRQMLVVNLHTCGAWSRVRFWLAHPVRTIRDCLHYSQIYVDAQEKGVFILDDANQVWKRSHMYGPRDGLVVLIGGPLLGLVLGGGMVMVASLGYLTRKWR